MTYSKEDIQKLLNDESFHQSLVEVLKEKLILDLMLNNDGDQYGTYINVCAKVSLNEHVLAVKKENIYVSDRYIEND